MSRVLIIGMNFSPEITGIGKYTGEMCTYMYSMGYDVQVITGYPYYPHWKCDSSYNPNWFKKESVSGINILRCPLFIPNPKKKYQRVLQELSFFFSSLIAATFFLFKKNKPSLLFVVSPSLLSGLVGLWYKLWCPSVTMVYHIQDLQIDAASQLGMFKQKKIISILSKIEKFILIKSDIVSTISDGMMKKVSEKSINLKKTLLFPNWVNMNELYPISADRKFLRRYNLPYNKQIILYSGAIGEKQGLEIIFDSALQLLDENILFVICGSGPYVDTLKDKCTDLGLNNIEFRPLLPVNEYNQLLNAAWLHLVIQKENAADLVMPSKLTSIMAVGGLSLVTANANTSLYNMVKENKLGRIIRPQDPESLTDAIRHLTSNPELVVSLKSAALNYAANYLNRDTVIMRFLESVEDTYSEKKLLIQFEN